MILQAFSKYLQSRNDDIINNRTTTSKLLCEWIKLVIARTPKSNVDKIVHKEIMLASNKSGDFFIVGKSPSGRVLIKALYNFALSYEQYIMGKWIAERKPEDFKN